MNYFFYMVLPNFSPLRFGVISGCFYSIPQVFHVPFLSLDSWLKEWKLRADREERKKQKDKKQEEGSNGGRLDTY